MKTSLQLTLACGLLCSGFGILSCSDNSANDDVGKGPIVMQDSDVYGLKDVTGSSFIGVEAEIDCEEGKLEKDEYNEDFKYSFEGDNLVLRYYGQTCTLSGGKTGTLTGTWKGTCVWEDEEDEEDGESVTVIFTKDKISINKKSSLCISENDKSYVEEYYSNLKISTDGCNSYTLTDSENNKLTYNLTAYNTSNKSATQVYTYNGKNCTYEQYGYIELTASVCSDAWKKYSNAGEKGSFFWDEWLPYPTSNYEEFKSCREKWDMSEDLKKF